MIKQKKDDRNNSIMNWKSKYDLQKSTLKQYQKNNFDWEKR